MTNAGESYGDRFDAYMAKELSVARADGVDKAFAALLARQADYLIIGLCRHSRGREPDAKLQSRDQLGRGDVFRWRE